MLRNPLHLLSLGFGSGLAPVAPGTCGTLVAIPLYLLMAQLDPAWYIVLVALSFGGGIYLCQYTSNALKLHDHPAIVWDEFVGFWITMIAVPTTWQWILLGFVLFRVFDIIKPWPVGVADAKMKGGFGIMIDDVLAGLYALACMQLALLAVGSW
ncbi:MAG: phosphatidylglycerophosphatase A [Gammaproteobacteria bacterium]|nr:phosphatidylglycerophosphatase A [Gammaproteobacteria bacterium]MDH3448525.1 phosphatidylglycerophosphatase A [Gammaproteobacteria bacterium]